MSLATDPSPPSDPPPPSPASPHNPSFNSLLLLALVDRSHAPASLHITHALSPNHAPSSPLTAAATDALLSAAPFIFPPHVPAPSPPHPTPSSAPPLSLTPTARTSSIISSPQHPAPSQLDRAVDHARTLPLSSVAVFDALVEPTSEPRLNPPPSAVPHNTALLQDSPRRANSLPKRPNSSPPLRLRSLGLPAYISAVDSRAHSADTTHSYPSPEELCTARRTDFRHFLLAAKTHVFAITARDGSRQYAYCRPLSATHALVVLSAVSYTAVYVSALEHTAARYALLVGDGCVSSKDSAAHRENFSRSFLAAQLMHCPPEVAKVLVRSLFDFLKAAERGAQGEKSYGLLKRTRSRRLKDNLEVDADEASEVDPNATWLTSSTTSSGFSSAANNGLSRRRSTGVLQDTSPERESGRFFSRKDSGSGAGSGNSNVSMKELPWESVSLFAEGSEHDNAAAVTRVMELTDATLLFRHIPVRGILSVIVALLEERRVCIVGPCTAIVSRAVIAFDNLLRPFEWPHLLSPILLEHMLPVLGAPFPFLVGIQSNHMEMTDELPLDEVIFADLGTGKVSSTQGETGALYRRVPRKMRNRFERRLTRAKNACMRQVNRSMSSALVPTVSNTATSYFQDGLFNLSVDKPRSSGLFRSKSQLRLHNEANPQNIWLDPGTVASLDRSMRKFFAELLEDLSSIRENDVSGSSPPRPENVSKKPATSVPAVSFSSTRREADRQQLIKAFCETQMFMHWEGLETSDATFGIVPSDALHQKKRPTAREKRALAKKPSLADEDFGDEDLHDVYMMNDAELECHEDLTDLTDDFMFDSVEVSTLKRFRNRGKSGRSSRTRLQFNSEVEEFGTDALELQSDVESNFMPKEDKVRTRSRRRNVSTDCVPHVEPNVVPLEDMRFAAKARRRRNRSTDFFPDVHGNVQFKQDIRSTVKAHRRYASTDCVPDKETRVLPKDENIRPPVKHRRRNASTDCVLDYEPRYVLDDDDMSPVVKHRRRDARTDCTSDLVSILEIEKGIAPLAKQRRRHTSSDCVPDVGSENMPKRNWLSLRLPSNRWTGRSVIQSPSPREDQYISVYGSDRLDEDYTEVEDSDDESDKGGAESESDIFPADVNGFSESRVRTWGKRRVRYPARVY